MLEGVMMRGRSTWAVACRRPNDDIYLESHRIGARRSRIWSLPLFRGVAAMGDALSIGMRAMMVAASQSSEEEARPTPGAMAVTIAIAVALFVGIFIVLPNLAANLGAEAGRSSIGSHAKEGAIRLGLFLGYLWAISFLKDIRRVFAYHGAEHKTIAAYEAGEQVLDPATVDRYSTRHVRCGTNFLIMVVLLTIVVYSFLGRPSIVVQVLQRVGLVVVIAGISYEGLRLGATRLRNPVVRALMQPGLWLQRITTRPPDERQIEVAIRSFEAVLPESERSRVASLPSFVVHGPDADDLGAPD